MRLQVLLFSSIVMTVNGLKEEEIKEICSSLDCSNSTKEAVCGVRAEGEGYKLKEFDSECELLKFGCDVTKIERYGLIGYSFCEQVFHRSHDSKNAEDLTNHGSDNDEDELYNDASNMCEQNICSSGNDTTEVCAIRKEDNAFRIKLFQSQCELSKHNCRQKLKYTETLSVDCLDLQENYTNEILAAEKAEEFFQNIGTNDLGEKISKLVVVSDLPFHNGDINSTVQNFFDRTHSSKLVLKQLTASEVSRRSMHNTHPGPVQVFEPVVPITDEKDRFDDYEHEPTLQTCFHKCPESCPDIYKPVCGTAGLNAREPSLLFKNHCFMDIAQCKMYRERKTKTSKSSKYQGLTFLFCLGDQSYNTLRLVPLIRSLQRMGRIRQRGSFHYRIQNYRTQNNVLVREPNFMG
ncbi:uncharacterized protein LOC119693067 [Plutella xylostella]|uniref:uncharacterized protein LOC119693067 n=1 Tax=Plutella xylostella TaxID=51655 RepID=UPI0020324562|nr:uncharacterized protein LOC119693067 [Plutella xylostella]